MAGTNRFRSGHVNAFACATILAIVSAFAFIGTMTCPLEHAQGLSLLVALYSGITALLTTIMAAELAQYVTIGATSGWTIYLNAPN